MCNEKLLILLILNNSAHNLVQTRQIKTQISLNKILKTACTCKLDTLRKLLLSSLNIFQPMKYFTLVNIHSLWIGQDCCNMFIKATWKTTINISPPPQIEWLLYAYELVVVGESSSPDWASDFSSVPWSASSSYKLRYVASVISPPLFVSYWPQV